MQPLVTVNILSYNRKEDLRHTLQKVFEQDYKNIEVIVVDNNSNDGSVAMVKSEFPAIRLIELQKNIGIAGWNEGAKAAKGEYLLFLDDDSYPLSDTIQRVIKNYCSQSSIIALDIRYPNSETYSNSFSESRMPSTFIGCGVIMPNLLFKDVGGFEPLLFLYYHEIEFSMRAFNKNYSIKYAPGAIVIHSYSRTHHSITGIFHLDRRRQYYMNRNAILILLLRFPFYKVFMRIFRILVGHLAFALYRRCFITVVRGFLSGIITSLQHWNKRLIVSQNVQHIYGNGCSLGIFFCRWCIRISKAVVVIR